MPDLDLLMEMSDFYGVDLRELLDGERTNKSMDKEVEETDVWQNERTEPAAVTGAGKGEPVGRMC